MTRQVIRAPRGSALSAKSWLTEAPLRMLMNNLDPEVAERPEDLVVYGGIGKAARDWACVRSHRRDAAPARGRSDAARPVGQAGGVFRTHADAPRVLIANSNLVPHWATWEHFNELDRKGLMMYGQMTAGSWIYIGSQGIVQGTYETFAEAGRQHYGGDWSGKWILTAGLGGMGGAQPLAATMAGASMLAIECESVAHRHARCKTGYLDERANTLDEALAIIERASADERRCRSACSATPRRSCREILKRARAGGPKPALVTDQTSAHDPANGYLPERWSLEHWHDLREARSGGSGDLRARVDRPSRARDPGLQGAGDPVRGLRQQHPPGGEGRRRAECLRLPGIRPGVHPSDVLRRQAGRSAGWRSRAIRRTSTRTDAKVRELFPHDRAAAAVARHGAHADRVPGAAGAHLLARPRRAAPRRTRLQRDGARPAS